MTTLLQNWNFMRLLRLGMGFWVIYSAFADRQPLLGLLGGLFVLQALTNTGCCAAGGCATPVRNVSTEPSQAEEIHYEEVK
ncbi:MAG: hypothetical protein U0X91_26595 [Spirosomataceae bacterium]